MTSVKSIGVGVVLKKHKQKIFLSRALVCQSGPTFVLSERLPKIDTERLPKFPGLRFSQKNSGAVLHFID